MKTIVVAALVLLSTLVHAQDEYVISPEDRSALDRLETPTDGAQYVRCRSGDCYIMETGEPIGEGQDGIYLVWPIDQYNETTEPTEDE